MKNLTISKVSLIGLSSLVLMACDPEFSEPVGDTSSYTSGDADFSNYVAIGDSITAGYADGALYRSGQINSLPNILATQFKTVNGGVFNQPLMNTENLGGLLFGGTASTEFINRKVFNGTTKLPETLAGTPTDEIIIGAPAVTGSFNNMGVPGAKSFHLSLAGYGSSANLGTSANPYFVRFASSTTTSVIADALAQSPSFFTLWIGNNDILSYATGGGAGTNQLGNVNPTTYASNDITDPTVFGQVYNGLVSAITTANPLAKGVLATIPNVSSLPFFTFVAHNPLTPSKLDSATIALLNSKYADYNSNLQLLVAGSVITAAEATKRTITFTDGINNAVVISDETLTDLTGINAALTNMRQATSDDLILLTTGSKIGTLSDPNNPLSAWGVATPLLDEDVLIPSEITAINTAQAAFNTTIVAAAAADDNLALYDAAAFMAKLKADGINYGTGSITAQYVSGGGFSLDGVHPTARGYSVLANGFIDTINTSFNAVIPKVDPGSYTTIFLK